MKRRLEPDNISYILLALPRDEQSQHLQSLNIDDLRQLAKELVVDAQLKSYNVGMLRSENFVKTASDTQLRQQIIVLLKQFPEVPSTKLALDRKFDDQEARMNAIIDDINSGRMPQYRYAELLYENIFFAEDHEVMFTDRSSRTFLAYAIPRLEESDILNELLSGIGKQLDMDMFMSYLETPMYLAGKDEPITIRGLYFEKHEKLNEVEFDGRESPFHMDKKEQLLDCLDQEDEDEDEEEEEINDINIINTHNVSSHRSGDESHVGAFKLMLESNKDLGAEVVYSDPNDKGELHRKVQINNAGRLDELVQSQLVMLSKEIDAFISTDRATLYEMYVKVGKDKPYSELDAQQKAKADEEINALLFQAGAAKRFMDNMIHDHRCDSVEYPYATNTAASCGLTMEQMVASCYWASKDREHFKNNADEADVLLLLIKQLYDMRRGYDIDSGTDNPDTNEFPANPGRDHNRCHSGCVNSLAGALDSIHASYNVKLIRRKDIEKAVKEIYEKIVQDNIEYIARNSSHDVLRIWSRTGKITGDIKEPLQYVFDSEHNNQIESLYKGYVDDAIFEDIMRNALDNVPMPREVKAIWSLENMRDEDIINAVNNNALPLLYLDKDKGYMSTLNYLFSLPNREISVKDLCDQCIANALYLSKSDLPDECMNISVKKIGNMDITLKEVKSMSTHGYKYLLESESEDRVLELSIIDNTSTLFELYCRAVSFTEETLNKKFGYSQATLLHAASTFGNLGVVKRILATEKGSARLSVLDIEKRTPLHMAAQNGYLDVVKEILETSEGLAALNMKDRLFGKTPLHLVVWNGHLEIMRMILETDAGKDALSIQDNDGKTPLHVAVENGELEIVKEILATHEGLAALSIKDEDGQTTLHLATAWGHVEIVKEILATHEGRATLSIKGNSGHTPLHVAVENGELEIVKAMLVTNEGRATLSIKDNSDKTPLHLATAWGELEIVKAILETKEGLAALSITNNAGRTPLDIAILRDKSDIVELIKEYQVQANQSTTWQDKLANEDKNTAQDLSK